MIQVQNVSFLIRDSYLFQDVSLTLNDRSRTALIGPNGAGKTTLLRIIGGELEADSGRIIRPRESRIGYLPQETRTMRGSQLLNEVLGARPEIYRIMTGLAQVEEELQHGHAEDDDHVRRSARLEELNHAAMVHDIAGYQAEAKKILSGLGFAEPDLQRPMEEFSGGWQMRAMLARLLLMAPDLLLFDEPTNHLDQESLEWLESYLLTFAGGILLVSHDRFFVRRLAREIADMQFGRLTFYRGGYQFYLDQKALTEAQLEKKAEQISKERERVMRFVNRFRYKNTKASQVQSRIKQLEKMEDVRLPEKEDDISFELKAPVKSYKEVCRLEDVSFAYTGKPVLSGLDLQIFRGEKLALVGPNGAGKTTLLRLIRGELTPVSGEVKIGERVQLGYFAQTQTAVLDNDLTVYESVYQVADPSYRTRVRDILGLFQFSGDDIEKKTGVCSGGERSRIALARILVSPVNFLLMDEPTNHLDIATVEALEIALQNYDGTIILISHDRYFLDQIVGRVLYLRDGHLSVYEGNYSDFIDKRNQDTKVEPQTARESKPEEPSGRKQRKRAEAEARQRISGIRRELEEKIQGLEDEISGLEEEKANIEKQMSDPEFYRDGEQAARTGKRYQVLQDLLPELYRRWEATILDRDDLVREAGK